MDNREPISRRDFLKLSGASAVGAILLPNQFESSANLHEFPHREWNSHGEYTQGQDAWGERRGRKKTDSIKYVDGTEIPVTNEWGEMLDRIEAPDGRTYLIRVTQKNNQETVLAEREVKGDGNFHIVSLNTSNNKESLVMVVPFKKAGDGLGHAYDYSGGPAECGFVGRSYGFYKDGDDTLIVGAFNSYSKDGQNTSIGISRVKTDGQVIPISVFSVSAESRMEWFKESLKQNGIDEKLVEEWLKEHGPIDLHKQEIEGDPNTFYLFLKKRGIAGIDKLRDMFSFLTDELAPREWQQNRNDGIFQFVLSPLAMIQYESRNERTFVHHLTNLPEWLSSRRMTEMS